MSTRSRKIRAERRMKDAQKWAGMKKPRSGRIRSGLAKDSRISVACKKDDPPLTGWRRPAELTLGG